MLLSTAIITTKEQCSAEVVIYPYQRQQVRDLAWACFSPSLLQIEQVPGATAGIATVDQKLTMARRHWLEQLDHDAAALQKHLSLRPTHRLGVYFEQLWHFFLQQDPEMELIAHNLPVRTRDTTLGEFDCIYYCHRRDCHVHLELAVKFFLNTGQPPASTPGRSLRLWVGPDNRDRLDLKLEHLLQRQILLSDNPAAQQALRDLGIGKLIKEVAFKGYLFQAMTADSQPPPGYNQECTLSKWVMQKQLLSHCAGLAADTFLILPKMRWLGPARCTDPAETLNARQLQVRLDHYFEHDTYPLLIAAMTETQMELCRFFVTSDNWPQHNL